MKVLLFASAAIVALSAAPALAQDHDAHAGHGAPVETAPAGDPHAGHAGHDMAAPAAPAADPHAGHDMSGMSGMAAMSGVLGAYPMGRDASGTSWQPDVSSHGGVHGEAGGWMLMGHATVNAVVSSQDGPRGDDMGFLAGMIMGAARREVGAGGTLNLRAMLSPDPIMGRAGYPLLLAAGETADGVTPLVDRQHPHDLFMELSASYAQDLGDQGGVFIYGGLPGEPAFGPPAFMHRLSAMDSPEAPITHHWLDSTHITFGVLTAGYVRGAWKLEASAFRGREPDEHRYDIESPKLDSAAVRLSWNPTANLALQASWADVESPEALEPDEDERRWSASAIYTVPVGRSGWWSTTAAFGRKDRSDGTVLDAYALETALKPNEAWTLFARAERIETDELEIGHGHGDVEVAAKLSAGVIRDFQVAENIKLGFGGLYTFNAVPEHLEPSYGGDPHGAMAFVRFKVG